MNSIRIFRYGGCYSVSTKNFLANDVIEIKILDLNH